MDASDVGVVVVVVDVVAVVVVGVDVVDVDDAVDDDVVFFDQHFSASPCVFPGVYYVSE